MVVRVANVRHKTNINVLIVFFKKKRSPHGYWLPTKSISPAPVTNIEGTNLEFRRACMERGHVHAKLLEIQLNV